MAARATGLQVYVMTLGRLFEQAHEQLNDEELDAFLDIAACQVAADVADRAFKEAA